MPNCRYCGAPMSNIRRVQCGATECRRRYDADRVREFLTRRKNADGVRYEDRFKVESACVDCGGAIWTRHNRSQRCRSCGHRRSSAASNAFQAARFAAARDRRKQLVPAGPLRVTETLAFRLAHERLAAAELGSRTKRAIWVGASCRRCGESFLCMWTNALPVYCSRSCSRATNKTRRRAAQRGGVSVPYGRTDVFARDHWVCQLCGKRVKRRAVVPHPRAPVIDHIVPLAAGAEVGGVDAPWNVQCAHFLCNSIKRDLLVAPALF